MSAAVASRLAERIRAGGPLPVDQVMAEALAHYYASRDPFGLGGDFTTAPEISQMFGELIGLWCAVVWQSMGSPSRVVLAEAGPGRGTLMSDALRAIDTVPPFAQAVDVWLVETSPLLEARQRQALAGRTVRWAKRLEDLPEGPLLLVTNELFDALPIRQFIKTDGGWRERVVTLDTAGKFTFAEGPEAMPDLPKDLLDDAGAGAIAETCPEGRRLAALLGRRLATQGGAALIVDYGHGRSAVGETLQAVKAHKYHAVLDELGEADLTAHVDFQALAEAAIPARAHGVATQGDFLRALGVEARAAVLARGAASRDKALAIAGQLRRLIDPAEMGTLFKVLALAHPALPAPPGFP